MEINEVELKHVAKSSEGMCATDSRGGGSAVMLKVSSPKADKRRWMESRSLWVEKNLNRVFVPVILRDRFYWMDAITGTFYDQAGKCKSAGISIDVSCLRNNPQKAQAILLEAKPGECPAGD